jgi:proline iminopeptidase
MKLLVKLTLLLFASSCASNNRNADLKSENGIINSGGIPFRYVIQGKGNPILVIGSSSYYSKSFSDNLKDHFEMIFIDSRHFIPEYEPSEDELTGLNLDTWADDVEMMRKELGLGKIIVAGHSIHAQIALRYSSKYPENVKKLVLICGVPYSFNEFTDQAKEYWDKEADDNRKSISKLRLQKLESIRKNTPPNKQFSAEYTHNSHLYWADPNYDAGYLLDDLLTSPKAFNVLFRSVPTRQESLNIFQNLTMPVLVICGNLDFSIPHTVWETLIQNSRIDYKLIMNAGHNPQTENTSVAQFDSLLIEWIPDND